MKCEPASKLSLVSGNYHEPAEPVVMVMASIHVKIRHVFADTPLTEESIGAAPPVIVKLSDLITNPYKSKVSKRRLTDTKKKETKRMISRANCNTMFLFFLTADNQI